MIAALPSRIVFAALFLTAFGILPADASVYQVTKVITGETIDLYDNGKITHVRLAGIDAPEPSESSGEPEQPFATSARNYLATQVLNRDVEIRSYGFNAEGFLLAEVFRGDRNINLSMLLAGLAEVYTHQSIAPLDLDLYREVEAEARRNARGMWILGKDYISPTDWRRMRGR